MDAEASRLAELLASESARVADYEAAVADAVGALGHSGSTPDDLADAVGQLDRLLRGLDLAATGELSGMAESIRVLTIYAWLGAWWMQGITRAPIVCEKGSPELIDMFNAGPPPWDVLRTIVRPTTATLEQSRSTLEEWLRIFDRRELLDVPSPEGGS